MSNSMFGGIVVNRGWTFLKELSNSILSQSKGDHHYVKEVEKAHAEWVAAQNYFENVVEPDLVDYAIYKVEASRRKYMYMLKQAKASGITKDQLIDSNDEEIFS